MRLHATKGEAVGVNGAVNQSRVSYRVEGGVGARRQVDWPHGCRRRGVSRAVSR
jgi:hypothetical protein